ncbi:MAG: aspartate--tRNA ligase [Candidatus Auribacterota bacterium]|nr:aspartate--tRNA ligase [Candidatus Auribacterota bacterium]
MNFKKRIYCGKLRLTDVGRVVQVAGWVDALRDHGVVLFAHLRDRSGIVQVVFSPEEAPGVRARAGSLKEEFCVAVTGRVIKRSEGTANPALDTGEIEIVATELTILSPSQPLPFSISEKAMVIGDAIEGAGAVAEDTRLQYRYLDLRRPSMQANLIRRHRIIKSARDLLDEQGFIEVETPVLTRSTPEGARDYLVPSRVHPGHYYALPQSPQLFKQLLMVSGFERYFQMVRCYRDEDLRPNRQPEFTQLDLEASFIDEEFIYELFEELTTRMFAIGGIELPRPFPRLTYQESIDSTGSDRPDLRFGLRFIEATDLFRNTGYSIFKQILKRGGHIKGINVKGQAEVLSKNVLQNEYAKKIVPGFGARGMTWMRVEGGKLVSNIVRFFNSDERQAILDRFGGEEGDVLLMIADPSYELVTSVLGQLRLHIANRLDLIPENIYRPVWVTDFPLFNATDDGITPTHHPFTAPARTDFDPADREEMLALHSRAYDLVMNGEELGGGSIRIHDAAVQQKIFQALGLSKEEVKEKFGFFLKALEYGAPPHGGIALGMDRVTAMILGAPSIREVIAFPKNRSAFCPLTGAPAPVARGQLAELGLLNQGESADLPGAEQKTDPIGSLSWVSRIGVEEKERPSITTALESAARLAGIVNGRGGDEEPLYSVVEPVNRTREGDEAKNSPLALDGELLKNAPACKGDYFKVAAVLE